MRHNQLSAVLLLGSVAFSSFGEAVGTASPFPTAEERTAEKPSEAAGEDLLTLGKALTLALQHSPDLAAHSWDIRAGEARILQASLRPNPELELEIEEVRWSPGPEQRTDTFSLGGSIEPSASLGWEREAEQGARSGFRESEFTLAISQLIELGGKRAKRIRLAERGKELALWDYEVARANVIAAVAEAFVEALEAQERLTLQEELVLLAKEVHRSTSRRVVAGQVSPLEGSKAEIALATAKVQREQAASELAAARARLAATWGDERPVYGLLAGRLDDVAPVPPLDRLKNRIAENPDVARWAAELAAKEAKVALERAKRFPDPTLTLGLRSTGLESKRVSSSDLDTSGSLGFSISRVGYDSDRDNSLVLGFSIPLPVFNRNQGSNLEAEYLVSKASTERRAAEIGVTAALSDAYHALSAAYTQVETLRSVILPRATDSFEKTQEGYAQGKFSYLDVLDAQRTLFDARRSYLSALGLYHKNAVRIERFTGQSLIDVDITTEQRLKEETRVE